MNNRHILIDKDFYIDKIPSSFNTLANNFKKFESNILYFFSTILTILFIFSSMGLSAATYFIAPNGSDKTGDGTSNNPWQSLYKACNSVTTEGDIIHLKSGTYNETSMADLSVGVSIEGEGIDITTIKTSYVAPNSFVGSICLNSVFHSDVKQSISFLTLDGNKLTATRAICINYRNNVTVHHCKILDFYADAICFRESKEKWDIEPSIYCTGNGVNYCILNNCATRSASESSTIRIKGQSGFLLHHNSFTQTSRIAGENGNILGGEWNKALNIISDRDKF